jgi:hypothetical protein
MMNPTLVRRITAIILLPLLLALEAEAQIEVRAKCDGEWLPVVACDSEDAFVMQKGKRKWVGREEIQVQPATVFGEGAAVIENEQIDLDPLRDAAPKDRSKPGAIAFRYKAEVSSQAPLESCYAVLVFVANGSVGTHMVPLGGLGPERKRPVKIELTTRVDRVAHLHVFSRSSEVRSNKVAATYSAREYWAE